jgi:hypothetical protein
LFNDLAAGRSGMADANDDNHMKNVIWVVVSGVRGAGEGSASSTETPSARLLFYIGRASACYAPPVAACNPPTVRLFAATFDQ